MLGKNPGIIQAHANTKIDPLIQEEFLSSQFLEKIKIDVDVSLENNEEDFTPVPKVENIIRGPTEVGSDTDTATEKGSSSEQTSSMSSSAKRVKAPEMNVDDLECLAGWMAFVYRKKYPQFNLGYSSTSTVSANMAQLLWIKELTYGGLMITQRANYFLFLKPHFSKIGAIQEKLSSF